MTLKWHSVFLIVVIVAPSMANGWEKQLDGGAQRNDQIRSVALDSQANVIAAGYLTVVNGPDTEFFVAKFDGLTGDMLWGAHIVGTGSILRSVAEAVTVDANDDVFAAGYISKQYDVGYQLIKLDFAVVKISGTDGSVLWRQDIAGSLNPFIADHDQAFSIALDANGDAFACGNLTTDARLFSFFAVIKFDGSSGNELWRQLITGALNAADSANAVVTDGNGDAFVAGYLWEPGHWEDFTVVKLSGSSGAEEWRTEINGTASQEDRAYAITLDSKGNVLVAGITNNVGTLFDFTVVKLDPSNGEPIWLTEIDGQAHYTDAAYAVAADPFDDVLAAGEIRNRDMYFADFATVKLDGQTGAELWRSEIQAQATSTARDVKADANGDVVTVGELANPAPGTGSSLATVKLNGKTGEELWRVLTDGTHTGSELSGADSVAFDPDGNAIVGGSVANRYTRADWALLKFAPDGSDF